MRITLPAGDKIAVQRSETEANYGHLQITVTDPHATDTSYEYGTADIEDTGPGVGTVVFGSDGINAPYTASHNQLDLASSGSWIFGFSSTGTTPALVTAHLLVVRGTTSFTLDVLGASQPSGSPSSCIAGVQVTPAG